LHHSPGHRKFDDSLDYTKIYQTIMTLSLSIAVLLLSILCNAGVGSAFSVTGATEAASDRRSFLMTSALVSSMLQAVDPVLPALAAPEIFTTPKGVKYAILQESKEKTRPSTGDIVAIEYTGYLTDGSIFGTFRSSIMNNSAQLRSLSSLC
jgi:hypothetical protein